MLNKTLILNILVALFIFQACSNTQEEMPKPPVEYEKMVQVLSDVHILEGSMQGIIQEQKDSIAKVYYAHIFKIHGITQYDFYESYNIFSQDPMILEKMYEAVKDSIQKKNIYE